MGLLDGVKWPETPEEKRQKYYRWGYDNGVYGRQIDKDYAERLGGLSYYLEGFKDGEKNRVFGKLKQIYRVNFSLPLQFSSAKYLRFDFIFKSEIRYFIRIINNTPSAMHSDIVETFTKELEEKGLDVTKGVKGIKAHNLLKIRIGGGKMNIQDRSIMLFGTSGDYGSEERWDDIHKIHLPDRKKTVELLNNPVYGITAWESPT